MIFCSDSLDTVTVTRSGEWFRMTERSYAPGHNLTDVHMPIRQIWTAPGDRELTTTNHILLHADENKYFLSINLNRRHIRCLQYFITQSASNKIPHPLCHIANRAR
jgi:hypothetical protein